MTTFRIRLATLLLLGLGAAAHAQPGQSLTDLRRENDHLRERVSQLEAQLESEREDAATAQQELRALCAEQVRRMADELRQLRAENEALKKGEAYVPPAKPDSGSPAALPDDPFACPDSMLAALRKDYVGALADQPRTTDVEQERYLRAVRLWTRQMEGRYRRTVEWEIEILGMEEIAESRGKEMLVRFRVLDPETAAARGDPIDQAMPTRYLRRAIDEPDRKRWNLRALFAVEPEVNPQRAEEGLFPTPPFIGPYADFVYELRVQSIVPSEPGP